MAHPLLHSAFRRLLGQIAREGSAEASDGLLLEKFSSGHNAQAFAELVRRHGPMVLGVCRRVLHDAHDAEDVCQATFLVLARKAAGLSGSRSLGNWLYTVAHNLAVNARISAARRRTREREAGAMVERDADCQLPELRAALDAELGRLPAKYREAIVLCYLEGKTHEAAAQELGWPLGSVAKRLERGREMLRQRLARRGIGVSAALLATYCTETTRAEMPAVLVDQISSAATAFAVSSEAAATLAASRAAAAYAEGMLHTMTMTKLKTVAALLACLGLLGTGAAILAQQALVGADPAAPAAAAERSPEPSPAPNVVAADVPDGAALPTGATGRLGALRFRQKGNYVFGLAIAPDGKTAASACEQGLVHIWDTATGKELQHWQVCKAPQEDGQDTTVVTHQAFSPDGRRLAVATTALGQQGWKVALWDLAKAQRLHEFQGPLSNYPIAAFSPDGKFLTTWSDADDVLGLTVWDTATGKEARRIACPNMNSIVFAPDGRYLATISTTEPIQASGAQLDVAIYDWENGKRVRQFPVKVGAQERGFITGTFSEDSRLLALTPGGTSIHFIETLTGKERRRVKAPGAIYQMFSAGGGRLLAANCIADEEPLKVRTWEWATGAPDKTLLVQESLGIPAVLTPESARVGQGLPGGNLGDQPIVPRELLYCAAAAPRGNLIAFGGNGVSIRLWDAVSGERLHQGAGHRWAVNALAYSPDGALVATGSADRLIKIWDAASRKLVRQYLAHSRPVTFLAFTADGKQLLSGALGEKEYTVLDVASAPDVAPQRLPLSEKDDQALLAGRFAYAAAAEKLAVIAFPPVLSNSPEENAAAERRWHVSRVRLYDRTGRCLRTLPAAVTAEAPLAFSPDGAVLAVALPNGSVALYDARTGKEQLVFNVEPRSAELAHAEGQAIQGLCFAPSGKQLAVVRLCNNPESNQTGGCIVSLWDLATAKELRQLDPDGEAVRSVAFAPDGKLLATVSSERTLRLWDPATGRQGGNVAGHDGPVHAVAFAPHTARIATASQDTTVLFWNVNELLEKKAGAGLDLERCWAGLGSDQSDRIDEAVAALVARPNEAVPFLAKRVRPIQLSDTDKKQLQSALADLDSPHVAVRQKATETLEALGEAADPALQDALQAKPALDKLRRVEAILAKLETRLAGAESLQALRAIEVLEHIGTKEARLLLTDLSRGVTGTQRTREAQAALTRLESRP